MLVVRGMQFLIEVTLVCIRRYAAYPLSCRHLEEIMGGAWCICGSFCKGFCVTLICH